MVVPTSNKGLFEAPNAWDRNRFEHHGGSKYIASISLSLGRDSRVTWEEVAIDKQCGLVIENSAYAPSDIADFASSVDFEREVVVDVRPFQGEAPVGVRLYPAFGEVIDVDCVKDRVYVRLLEAPFSRLLSLPLYTENGVASLRHIGQFFEAQATLTAKDQSEFRLGNIQIIEQEEPESFYDAVRNLAEPTAKLRF